MKNNVDFPLNNFTESEEYKRKPYLYQSIPLKNVNIDYFFYALLTSSCFQAVI